MTAIAAVFAVLLPGAILFQSDGSKMADFYLAALLVQYVLNARAARNHGNRFALNVLSEEVSVEPCRDLAKEELA